MTNSEKLTEKLKGTILESMTDADIADWFNTYFMDCDACPIKKYCRTSMIGNCEATVREWLAGEAKLE